MCKHFFHLQVGIFGVIAKAEDSMRLRRLLASPDYGSWLLSTPLEKIWVFVYVFLISNSGNSKACSDGTNPRTKWAFSFLWELFRFRSLILFCSTVFPDSHEKRLFLQHKQQHWTAWTSFIYLNVRNNKNSVTLLYLTSPAIVPLPFVPVKVSYLMDWFQIVLFGLFVCDKGRHLLSSKLIHLCNNVTCFYYNRDGLSKRIETFCWRALLQRAIDYRVVPMYM